MDQTAKALEIPFSNVPVAPAIRPDASLRFLASMNVQSGVVPAGIVAQTGLAFPLPNANRNLARLRPLHAGLARDKSFLARALFSAPLVPFASSARRSFGIF